MQYLESFLGKIERGWSKDADGKEIPFQVVKYSGGPFPNTVTYSTLGLSNEKLASPVSIKQIRQELIFISYSSFGDKNVPGILQQVGLRALKSKNSYLRGEVIGPYGPLFKASELEALYVTIPVYFPDSFHTFNSKSSISVVQSWLVPITSKEANFVKQNGWDKFEDILEDMNPDLVDFYRTSVVN